MGEKDRKPRKAEAPDYPVCGVRRKEARGGGACHARAGAGTDHPGVGKCKWHGGTSRSNRTHAARLEADERLKTLGVALDVKPIDALLAMVQVSAGAVAWLREQVGELAPDEIGKHQGRVLIDMYGTERDRLTRTSKAAVESGVAERQVRLAENQGELTVKLIRNVLLGLGLSREQEATAKELVRKELAAVAGLESGGDGPTGTSALLGK